MRWRYRLLGWALFLLPSVLLFTASIVYLYRLAVYISPKLAPVVAQVAAESVHRQIRIGKVIAFGTAGKFELLDVVVSNTSSFATDTPLPALSAESITVNYNLLYLLTHPRDAIGSISKINVVSPIVYVERLKVGKYNFSDLIVKKASGSSPPFMGVISAQNATFVLKDDAAPSTALRQIQTYSQAVASADFTSSTSISFTMNSTGNPHLVRSIAISGQTVRNDVAQAPGSTRNPQSSYGLDIVFKGANLAYFAPYAVPTPKLNAILLAGVGNGEFTLKQVGSIHAPLEMAGSVRVAGVSFRLPGTSLFSGPITGIDGSINFTQNDVDYIGSAVMNGQKFALNGILFDFRRPQVALEADSNRIDYSQLRRSLTVLPELPSEVRLSGPIVEHAWISGALGKPTIDVTVDEPTLAVACYPLSNLDVNLTYSDKILDVHSLTADNQDGDDVISASGQLDATKRQLTYSFLGQLRSVDIAEMPIPENVKKRIGPLTAMASAVFEVNQNGIDAKIASNDGIIHGVHYVAAAADVSWEPGRSFDVHHFFVRLPGSGIVAASGSIPQNNKSDLNIQFHAAQVDLSQLQSTASSASVQGLAYAQGALTGTIAAPTFTAHIFVLQPQAGQYKADELTADLQGSSSEILVQKLSFRYFPGTVSANGLISNPFGQRPRINLAVTIHDLPISYLATIGTAESLHANMQYPLSGFIDGTAAVIGSYTDPIADANLTLNNGLFQELQLQNVSTNVEYRSGIVDIEAVHGSVAGVDIVGSGRYIAASDAISLDVNATTSDLAQVTQRYAPQLQIYGGLAVAATMAGTVKNPMVSATIATKGVSVEGSSLAIAPVTLNYQQNELTIANGPFEVSSAGAHYQIDALKVNFATKQIMAEGSVHGESLTHLLTIEQRSPYLTRHVGHSLQAIFAKMPQQPSGSLEVSRWDVDGALNSPVFSVNADLTDAEIGGQAIDRLQTQFTLHSSQVSITELLATGPNNAFMQASGTVDPAGVVNAQLEVSNLSLNLLNPYLPHGASVGGTMSDFTLLAAGKFRAPDLTASIELDKPKFKSFTLDRIDSGEIDIRHDAISISGLTFTKEEDTVGGAIVDHTLSVAGTIPFSWRKSGFLSGEFPAERPISVSIDLPSQSIGFVNQMLPKMPVLLPHGTAVGHLMISGTLADKQVNGEVSLTDGQVALLGYQSSLTHVNVDIALDGKDIVVRKCSVASNFGGTINLTGGAEITGGQVLDTISSGRSLLSDLNVSLNAVANNFVLNEKKLAIFDDADAAARINNSVTINGPVLRPLIHGDLNVDNVVGSLPQTQPAVATVDTVPAFNPRFDVTVNIKPEAIVRTAQLNAVADGSVTLKGSFYRPRIDGKFVIRKGEFYFPTATFKVVPIGTVDIHYRPPNETSELVDMTASTSISVTPDIIQRNPAALNSTSTYVPSLTNVQAASQRYTVTVDITGDLETPGGLHLTFQSNPPGLTDSQILAVLGGQEAIAGLSGGNIVSALQNQVAAVFNASVVPKMLQPFEDTIGTVFGLEDFSIDYAPESPVQVTLVKRIGNRITLQYVQSINSRTPGAVSSTLEPPVYQVKLGYSFTPRLQATISTDDQQNYIVAIEGVHKF
jgi:hypothetical protein